MKVLNNGERQYMIGGVLVKPQQTVYIEDKYKSVVESYEELEIVQQDKVESDSKPEPEPEVEPEAEAEEEPRPRGRPRKTNNKK